jgi:non-specific protein-tyrosine kinase
MLQVLLAAAIGGILAIGAAFLIEYLDDTLKTPDDVTRVTGLTTVGAISRIEGSDPADKLITARHPKSPISEAYRVMRTNLQFSSLDRPLHSLVVTSPQPTEGKTTTVSNLGVVMAQSGKRVILVDSDLRRPSLHKHFGVSNKDGLTSVLLEDEPMLNGRLQATGVDNLQILTSGPLPPNPSELLGSQRMQNLLEQLLEHADIVLFDTPPSLPVTDAAVLATQTDGVLIVTDSGRTRRNTARDTVERLQTVGANTLGVALNRLKPGRSGAYYYYYYEYRYGNGKTRRQSGGLRRFLPWLRKK